MARWPNSPDRSVLDAAIREIYPTQGSAPLVARFGLSKSLICKRAKSLCIATNQAERQAAAVTGRSRTGISPSLRHDYFETWSANMAWLLGYVWTDGSIKSPKHGWQVGFGCVADDVALLQDIQTELRCGSPIFPKKGKVTHGYQCRDTVHLMISSKLIVQSLLARGVPPNKSNIDPPMPDVPDEWLSHFTRGVIDGDGSFTTSKCRPNQMGVKLLGTHRFIEAMRFSVARCAEVRVPNRWLRRDHGDATKLSVVKWGAVEDVIALVRWLYPKGAYLALQRKRDKAAEFLNRAR